MKKFLYILLLFPMLSYGQTVIYIKSGYIVMANGTQAVPTLLVVHNPAVGAITRTAGGIITGVNAVNTTTNEYNQVQWDIGNVTATYVLPFYRLATDYIPLTVQLTGAPAGGGSIRFSTWETNNDNLLRPHGVTNMTPKTLPGSPSNTDDSYNVVDRFWIIDAHVIGHLYTTLPDPHITFTYLNSTNGNSEVTGSNNAIDNTLIAQRFDTVSNSWGGYFGSAGTTATGTSSTVATGANDVTAGGFYRAWTLASINNPLPIDVSSFTADCNNYYALLNWTTATETSNKFFTIDRTSDGVNYKTISIIPGAGTTSTTHSYSTIDYSPLTGISYYRLSQTDFDGTINHYNEIVYIPCENANTEDAFVDNTNTINVQINTVASDNYTITLVNMVGQSVYTESHSLPMGNTVLKIHPNVSDGVYILNIRNENTNYNKKLFIGR